MSQGAGQQQVANGNGQQKLDPNCPIELRITVLPPEHFVKNEGRISSLACTDSFVALYRQSSEGALQYVVYDARGNIATPPKLFPGFGVTRSNVSTLTNKSAISAIDFVDGAYCSYSATVSDIAAAVGEPERENDFAAHLRACFQVNDGRLYIGSLHRDEMLIPLESEILTDAEKQVFVFRRPPQIFVWETKSEDGSFVDPSNWGMLGTFEESRIPSQLMKNRPYLREFVRTAAGRRIGDLDLYIDNQRGTLDVIDGNGKRIYADASAGYGIDPVDGKTIYYINPVSHQLVSFQAPEANLTGTPTVTRDLPFSPSIKIERVAFDPQGNFLVLHVVENGNGSIVVLEKDTLQKIGAVENVKGHVSLDTLGNIYFVDTADKLRFATTNFKTFPIGGLQAVREKRRQELLELQERLAALKLPDLGTAAMVTPVELLPEEGILDQYGKALLDKFGPEVESAGDIEAVERLERQFEALKRDPQFEKYPGIFTPLDERLIARVTSVRLEHLDKLVTRFGELLAAPLTADTALDVAEAWGSLLKARRETLIKDSSVRKAMDGHIKELQKTYDAALEALSQQLDKELETKFKELYEELTDTGTPDELEAFTTGERYCEFQELVSLMTDTGRARGWRARVAEAVSEHHQALEARRQQEDEAQRERTVEQIEEAARLLNEVRNAVVDLGDADFRAFRKGSPLLRSFQRAVLALPENLQGRELDKLEAILQQAEQARVHTSQVVTPGREGEVRFGKQAFPRFVREPVSWHPEVVTRAAGDPQGELVFRDNRGNVFHTSQIVPLDLKAGETPDLIRRIEPTATAFFNQIPVRIPEYSRHWVLNEPVKETLGQMARLSRTQLRQQSGLLILEGDAGVGKDVLIDMFGYFTGREVFTFSCNFQTEKEDLTYAFEFDPERGTVRIPSELIRALGTPGAILNFGEVNTLPPGVSKLLNPVLDYRRTFFLPDGRRQKVHPSVILMGTMNPQHYLGTNRLPQKVKSRARIMPVQYPPETRMDGSFAPYEAEIMAAHVDVLAKLKQEEFYLLWDYLINNKSGNGGDKYKSKETEKVVRDLRHVVKTANVLRDAYRSFHAGLSNDVIEFVFSMRESVAIATELNDQSDVKAAIRDVILPKVGDPEECGRIETILKNV